MSAAQAIAQSPMRDCAFDYAARGYQVFPVPPGKKQGYKKAADYGGRRWGCTADPVEIEADWLRHPSANIGIACGPESGLFVIEVDTVEGHGVDGLANFARLIERHGPLPETVEAVTPSGSRHFYFSYPAGATITNSEGRIAPGVDVRGSGGMVIAPPSVKPGQRLPYRWVRAPGVVELAPCPDWLLQLCLKPEVPRAGAASVPRAANCDADEQVLGWLYTRPNDLSRDDWVRLGFALKNHFGDRARDAWLSFSARYCGAVRPGEAERQWETANPGGQVTLATAIHLLGGFEKREQSRRPPSSREEYDCETGEIIDLPGNADHSMEPCGKASGHGVGIDNFRAYMPAHAYIFTDTGELWPSTSVNSRIPPIPLNNRRGEPLLNKKGEQVLQKANAWLDENRAVEQMTWIPGKPQVIADRLVSDGGWLERPGCNVFNLYRPPLDIAGDATKAGPWIEHVRRVYSDDADHLLKWFAHRAQRPWEKVNHALVMGGAQGIGKDTILEPVKAAIGAWNFAEISPQHLLGRFNGFVKSVILRISEARDLGDVDRFAFYDHAKAYTAAPPDVLRVDEKHLREYAVFNVCGVIITTNHKTDGIYLPADDRRHYVAWSNLTRDAFPADYWQRLYGWYNGGGIGHVVAYLRSLDLTGFDAKAPPPKTPAFWDIVASNQAPEDAELADALETLGWPSAVTIASIVGVAPEAFASFLTDRKNSRRIPHRLEQCGYAPVRNDAASDGLFKIRGKRCVVYARNTLSIRDQIAAAHTLIGR